MLLKLPMMALVAALLAPALQFKAHGQLRKGFEALEVFDYFKARRIFQKETRKQPAAAWYGLSVIAGRADNPFFQIDSAYSFIQRSDAAYTVATDKQRKSLSKVSVDHDAILAQREHVFSLAWDVAKSQHTIAAYDHYIRNYIQSPRAADAVLVRDHLAFQEARSINTAIAYKGFLERYPRALQVYEARSRLQEAIYREATVDMELSSYTSFIREHPGSPYVRNAEEEVYRLYTPRRTVDEYKKFIQEQADNHRVGDAWRAIYEIRTRDLSAAAITSFLQEFPDYPFVEELVDDYRTASLVLLPFRRGDRWGFIDDGGVERIKAEYEWVEEFRGGQAIVSRDGHVGTINRSGREVVPFEYDDIEEAAEGASTVQRNDRAGAVDASGELVVPLIYEDVGEFSKGMAYVAQNGLYGYINARGEVLIPLQYASAGTFRNGMAVVEVDGRYGVIDTKGNLVVAPEYDWVEGFTEPLSRVRKDGRMGLIGPFGDVLLPLQYDHIGSFNDGLALVVEGRKCGYIDEQAKLVIPMDYEAAEGVSNWGDFQNGLAKVQQGGKRCMINTANTKVLSCQYVDIGAASGALIPVRKRSKWGFADRKGTVLFENRYDQAWSMVEGLARVRNGELFGLVDSTGREAIPPRYVGLLDPVHGFLVAEGPAGNGLLSLAGEEVVALVYDAVNVRSAKLAKVERNNAFGYIDLETGRFIWREEGLLKNAE